MDDTGTGSTPVPVPSIDEVWDPLEMGNGALELELPTERAIW